MSFALISPLKQYKVPKRATRPALVARLLPQAYRAKAEQAIVFEVEAWCTNCPSHIPQMLPAGEVAAVMAELQRRIRELEAENAALREHRPASGGEDA